MRPRGPGAGPVDSARRRTPALGDSASALKAAAAKNREIGDLLESTVKLLELAHGHPHSPDYGFGLSSEGALPFKSSGGWFSTSTL